MNIAYYLSTTKPMTRRLRIMRNTLFNSLLIDYASVCFRTLGHYPTSSNSTLGGHFSFILACFITTCFTYEFCTMYFQANDPKFYEKKKKEMTEIEKDLYNVYYFGIKPDSVKSNWFARNYNFFFMLRLVIICLVIFSMQYIQAVQVIASFVVILTFSISTLYNEIKYKIFDSKFIAGFRLVQEASIALILGLVNVFMYDSFFGGLSPKTKSTFVFIFIGLVGLNILLEVGEVIVAIVEWVRSKISKKNKISVEKKKIRLGSPNEIVDLKSNLDGSPERKGIVARSDDKPRIKVKSSSRMKRYIRNFNRNQSFFLNKGRVKVSINRKSRIKHPKNPLRKKSLEESESILLNKISSGTSIITKNDKRHFPEKKKKSSFGIEEELGTKKITSLDFDGF